jgi:hypothetical protein
MKFRDGMWLVAEGKRPEYAEDVYSITQHPAGNALSLLCPTKKILERADTLNLPTLTIVSNSLQSNGTVLTMPGHPSSIRRCNISRNDTLAWSSQPRPSLRPLPRGKTGNDRRQNYTDRFCCDSEVWLDLCDSQNLRP